MPGNSRYDAEHLRNVSSYLRQIDEIFRAADEEAARIAKASGAEYDPDRPFSFDDYPSVKKRVDKMTGDLASRVERTIVNGIKAQWELSNRKNDDLVETVTGLKADDFPSDQRRRYFGTNEPARDAFIRRETEGMNLSEEVWRFRRETEFGIDLSLKGMQDRMERGLSEGVSAADMSRELRGYLKNPDRLFRRVRDERGNLTLSRNARLFHPGQGVYRSSYMNARRLAATETNMAYRSADHERWKNLDFVVGIEIRTSNNHTTKDSKGDTVELEDICDTLAGRYPKDFKFVGWHPHCRCIATTILKTEEEMERDTERIMDGEEPLSPDTSKNFIGGLPEKFTKWLDKNSERIANAKSLPYFLKDNRKLIEDATGVAVLAGATATTTTTTPTTTTTTANAGAAQTATNPAPTTQQGNTDIIELDKNVPNWTFKGENTKDSLWARVKYFDESLERCYGKNLELLDVYDNVTREEWMNKIRDIIKKGKFFVVQSDYDSAKKTFECMRRDGECVANSINHLQELRKITTKDIPEIWRTAYNDAIKELNAYDFSKGYFGVYAKIEKAYNIYKLAEVMEKENLNKPDYSVNTPYNLFTEFKTEIPNMMDKLPPKEFFDMLKDFVPLVKCSKEAYYKPMFKTVYFSVDERFKVTFKQILIHEYGHAYDHQIGMIGKQDVKDTYTNWKTLMNGKDGKKVEGRKLEQTIINEVKTYRNQSNDATSIYMHDEDLGVLSDILSSVMRKRIPPRTHELKYFSSEENRLSEFVAHCWETYWTDLDNFRRMQPDLYDKMYKLAEKYK